MKTADIVDMYDQDVKFCHLPFLKIGKKRAFFGPVQTVKCYEDNVLLKAELEKPGKGRVLIVDGGGSTRLAILGDVIAGLSLENHWAGVILNAAVRDVAMLNQMDIGIRCLGTSPKKSAKLGNGTVSTIIEFGGVEFAPNDFVYVDEDGILVSKFNVLA
ncbi:ribonuclease E activity regulator RraA [Hellea balneolensis]|uniref:ribonuclease E activity regulator RraA n=1 Tax=Hellea balneolensis TaxID=287478 RepID=UPI000423A4E8|nr:ribonuclease E activity regulator RraA [Hellea balneolensis]